MRDWVTNVETTNYVFGTVAGPHPFPAMVRDLQRIIGDEAREQVIELTGSLPTAVAACVGGGSNAMGIFTAFLDDPEVALYGYEAAGDGADTPRHAATITKGRPGVLHGARSYLLQDEDGQTVESHSISAGLDYPGVGPEHAWLADIGRANYRPITDAAGHERPAPAQPHRGHHPRHRVGARPGRRARARQGAGTRVRHPGQPLRARRQGHDDRRQLLRPPRCEERSRCERLLSPHQPGSRRDTSAARRRHGRTGRLSAHRLPRPRRRASKQPSRSSRTASTSSSWACRTPIPSWTDRSSRPQPSRRSPTGSSSATRSTPCVRSRSGSRRPVLLMTYWNPIIQFGVDRFADELAEAGGAGLITPDLVPDEATEWLAASDRTGLDRVFLAAPSSSESGCVAPPRSAAASSTPSRPWASPAPAPMWTVQPADLVGRLRDVGVDGTAPSPASASASRPARRCARSSATPTAPSSDPRSSRHSPKAASVRPPPALPGSPRAPHPPMARPHPPPWTRAQARPRVSGLVGSTLVAPLSIPSPPSEWVTYVIPVGGLTFTIHAYALIILLGIIAAMVLTSRRLTARGAEPGIVIDIALWAVPLGIIGARLYHVFTHVSRLLRRRTDPLDDPRRRHRHPGGRQRHLRLADRRRDRCPDRLPRSRDCASGPSPTRSLRAC